MPIVREELGAKAPTGPHLAVIRNSSGAALALPVGAHFLLVMDPTRPDGVTPMLLVKVAEKYLTFRCDCGQAECTRVMKYRRESSGHHPQSKR